MYLSSVEERMVKGELGEAKALALRVIVKVGEALGAEELVEISHAHISGISYLNIGDAGLELIEDLAGGGCRVEVFTSANPYMVMSDYLGSKHGSSAINKQLRIISALNRMGVEFYTCAPYNLRPPKLGDHLAWAESNAVLYSNTVLGAFSNKEGGPLALFAAVVGRTHKSGVHLATNRRPKVLVRASNVDGLGFGFLGLMIGELVGERIPRISGLKFGGTYALKSFLAALGTTSNIPMAVIDGVTPGYKELIRDGSYEETFNLGVDDVKSYMREFSANVLSGRGLYLIGCPHLSFRELTNVLEMVEEEASKHKSQRDFSDRELWITTHRGFMGGGLGELPEKLSRYNVKLVGNACAVVSRLDLLKVDYVVTDSAKACSYIRRLSKIPVLALPTKELIRTYFTGELSAEL